MMLCLKTRRTSVPIPLNKFPPSSVYSSDMKTFLLSAIAISTLTVCADEPSWASQLSSPQPGSHAALSPMKLEYSLSWKGQVQAGQVTFTFGGKGSTAEVMHATCSGGSQGMAAKLFPYTFSMTGQVQKSSLAPLMMHCDETDKEETLVTTVNYKPGMVSVKEISRPHATGKDTTTTKSFAYTPVFDAFSSMLLIRSHALEQGDTICQVIHPFKSPYLAKITVLGREKINGKDAIKLNIDLTKIDKNLNLKPYKKMKTATLWISDDQDRIPLEMRVAAFIGDVRMTLTNKQAL